MDQESGIRKRMRMDVDENVKSTAEPTSAKSKKKLSFREIQMHVSTASIVNRQSSIINAIHTDAQCISSLSDHR
jgi:hypothetical protein